MYSYSSGIDCELTRIYGLYKSSLSFHPLDGYKYRKHGAQSRPHFWLLCFQCRFLFSSAGRWSPSRYLPFALPYLRFRFFNATPVHGVKDLVSETPHSFRSQKAASRSTWYILFRELGHYIFSGRLRLFCSQLFVSYGMLPPVTPTAGPTDLLPVLFCFFSIFVLFVSFA